MATLRQLLHAAVSAVALLAAPHAGAQPYPSQPVRFVVPSAAGSVVDAVLRKLAGEIERRLGQPVVIDNRPGANGIVGTELAARAKPDGYTVLMTSMAQMAINPALYAKLPYDPLRDFAPVTSGARGEPLLLVNPQLPARTLAELIDYAKARPGRLSYGSGGVGSIQHMTMEAFEQLAGVHMVHIPYKNSPDVMTDLIGGRLEAAIEFASVALPHLQSGKLRAIAVAGPGRKPALPDVPTTVELGMPGFDGTGWNGFLVPAGTPPEIVARLNRDITAALRAPEFVAWVSSFGSESIPSTPAEFGAFMAAEHARWSAIVKASGTRID